MNKKKEKTKKRGKRKIHNKDYFKEVPIFPEGVNISNSGWFTKIP